MNFLKKTNIRTALTHLRQLGLNLSLCCLSLALLVGCSSSTDKPERAVSVAQTWIDNHRAKVADQMAAQISQNTAVSSLVSIAISTYIQKQIEFSPDTPTRISRDVWQVRLGATLNQPLPEQLISGVSSVMAKGSITLKVDTRNGAVNSWEINPSDFKVSLQNAIANQRPELASGATLTRVPYGTKPSQACHPLCDRALLAVWNNGVWQLFNGERLDAYSMRQRDSGFEVTGRFVAANLDLVSLPKTSWSPEEFDAKAEAKNWLVLSVAKDGRVTRLYGNLNSSNTARASDAVDGALITVVTTPSTN